MHLNYQTTFVWIFYEQADGKRIYIYFIYKTFSFFFPSYPLSREGRERKISTLSPWKRIKIRWKLTQRHGKTRNIFFSCHELPGGEFSSSLFNFSFACEWKIQMIAFVQTEREFFGLLSIFCCFGNVEKCAVQTWHAFTGRFLYLQRNYEKETF